jgi:dihydroorotase
MRIDPHTHCRDTEENYKDTIKHVLQLCGEQGVDIIFDMPNTKPPLVSIKELKSRLALVPHGKEGQYKVYMGLTSTPKQIDKVIDLAMDHTGVVGLKMFTAQSIGNLALPTKDQQSLVYNRLAKRNYEGVLAVHCEQNELLKNNFDPKKPITHTIDRPAKAETESIKTQIRLASQFGFKGTLHICHISTKESVDIINNARKSMKITCGVTPHHLLWTKKRYYEKNGLLYKVNPPLRSETDVQALRYALSKSMIDWIETDHAPHPISEKLYPPYLSGYPSLCLYKDLVDHLLPQWGIPKTNIDKLTFSNIVNTFGERKVL